MLFFKNLLGGAAKGVDHLANLSTQVNGHLSEAQTILQVAAMVAGAHDDQTSKTVANLTNAINEAIDTNNQVQAKAKELSTLAELIGTIVKP